MFDRYSIAILPLFLFGFTSGISSAHAEKIDLVLSEEPTTLPQELRVIYSLGKGESCDAAYSAMMKHTKATSGELTVPMAYFGVTDPNSLEPLPSLSCEPAGKKVKVEARVLMAKLHDKSAALPREKVVGIISSTAVPKGKPFAGGTPAERDRRLVEQSGDMGSRAQGLLSVFTMGKKRPYSATDLAIRGLRFSDRRSGIWILATSPYVSSTYSKDHRFTASELFKSAARVPLLKWAEALQAHPEIDGLHISAVSERKRVGAGSSYYRFNYFVPRKAAELFVAGDDAWAKTVQVETVRGGENIKVEKPYFR